MHRRHRWKLCTGIAGVAVCIAVLLIWPSQRELNDSTTKEQTAAPLPKVDQEFLWDAESVGLELGQFAWPQFSDALRTANADAISALFANGFQAEISSQSKRIEVEREFGWLRRSEADGNEWKRLDASAFTLWLLDHRAKFAEAPNEVKFSLKAISPLERDQPTGDWRGTVAIEIRSMETSGSRRELVILLDFQSVHPERKSLAKGCWLRSCRVLQVNTAHSAHPLMSEVAIERGLPDNLHDNWVAGGNLVNTGGAYFCDYNRDGCLDVLLMDTSKFAPSMLYRGSPEGQFVEVTRKVGLATAPPALHAAFVDIDNDGWEDLVLPGVAIYRNVRGARFEEMTNHSNLIELIASHGPLVNVTGITVADYDRDGRIDIYVTRGDARNFKSGSWIDGKSGMQWQNQLLRNLGSGTFADVTAATGTSGDHRSVFTAAWLDANDDGLPDIYIIHEFGPGVLLIQRPDGPFQQHQLSQHSSDFGSMGLAAGDIDNDGQIDLFVSNMYSKAGNRVIDNLPSGHYDEEVMRKLRRMVAGSELYVNHGGLAFEAIAKQVQVSRIGWGWGPALVDLDNDGWLDLYSTCGFISHDRKKPDG
jgi:hypothetical protein